MAAAVGQQNSLIHQLYVRQVGHLHSEPQQSKILQLCDPCSSCHCSQQFEECATLIDRVLSDSSRQCEYALHVKALIARQKG